MSDAADVAVSGTTNESAHCGTRWQLATHPSSPMCHASFVGGGRLAPPTLHGETKIFSTSPHRASTRRWAHVGAPNFGSGKSRRPPHTARTPRTEDGPPSRAPPPRRNRARERERSTSGPEGFPELPCARARALPKGRGALAYSCSFSGLCSATKASLKLKRSITQTFATARERGALGNRLWASSSSACSHRKLDQSSGRHRPHRRDVRSNPCRF